MDPKTGRCAILFPHGVLFRNEEAEMRTKLIEADLLECVLELGPNSFYNSPMEACVLICRNFKPPERRGKVLFINALNEVAREKAQSFLKPEHQAKILETYQDFADKPGFAFVATTEEVLAKNGDLSIPKYVEKVTLDGDGEGSQDLPAAWASFEDDGAAFWTEMDSLVEMLDRVVAAEANDA